MRTENCSYFHLRLVNSIIFPNFAVQGILQSSLQTKMSLSSKSKNFIKQILHERIKGNNHEKTYVVYRNNNCEWHY